MIPHLGITREKHVIVIGQIYFPPLQNQHWVFSEVCQLLKTSVLNHPENSTLGLRSLYFNSESPFKKKNNNKTKSKTKNHTHTHTHKKSQTIHKIKPLLFKLGCSHSPFLYTSHQCCFQLLIFSSFYLHQFSYFLRNPV